MTVTENEFSPAFSTAFDAAEVPEVACQPWPVKWPCNVEGVDPADLADAQAVASAILWGLSGRRIGVCTYTEGYWPPCSGSCGVPYKDSAGNWRNGGRGGACCRILLFERPVQAVTAVTIEGVPLTEGEWSVDRHAWLRRDGACWPCGDPCLDPPVLVTYDAGVPFPPGTAQAVGEYACELLKGWSGDPCKLPARAVSVSRQGVTVELGDPGTFLENGLTGLPVVDAWLRFVNLGKLQQRSKVMSPDLARRG